uniref:Uncharacterized protein n=1 Tax=Vespula pensylvanica TaxID=30213 RepID=A0A834P5Y6_VESPE|nr:hypothetical protein H0235_006111 [Vespula pensylvanica]
MSEIKSEKSSNKIKNTDQSDSYPTEFLPTRSMAECKVKRLLIRRRVNDTSIGLPRPTSHAEVLTLKNEQRENSRSRDLDDLPPPKVIEPVMINGPYQTGCCGLQLPGRYPSN